MARTPMTDDQRNAQPKAAAGGAVNNGLQRYTQAYRELLQEEPRGGLLGLLDLIRGN